MFIVSFGLFFASDLFINGKLTITPVETAVVCFKNLRLFIFCIVFPPNKEISYL
jgi:hypothetical protein